MESVVHHTKILTLGRILESILFFAETLFFRRQYSTQMVDGLIAVTTSCLQSIRMSGVLEACHDQLFRKYVAVLVQSQLIFWRLCVVVSHLN